MSKRTLHANCWCRTCEDEWLDAQAMNGDDSGWWTRPFIVCPDCGNKRCPKATSHHHTCTGSNEPGQAGSFYGNAS